MGIISIVRNVLGEMIVFLNWLFKPTQLMRSDDAQVMLDKQCQGLSLYQFHRCPFCVKVRREMHRLNVRIPLCDVNKNESYRTELLEGGGKVRVPCLKIVSDAGVEWMYESSDINDYLNELVKDHG